MFTEKAPHIIKTGKSKNNSRKEKIGRETDGLAE
jgi:hypothetical protein